MRWASICKSLSQKMKSSRAHRATLSAFARSYRVETRSLVPKKFVAVGHNGSLKSSARKVEDYARIANPSTLEQFKIGERTENNDDLHTDIPQQLENPDQDLHHFITRVSR